MRKSLFITLTLYLLSTYTLLSKGLNDTGQPLSNTDRLYLTCKIWGFLKYYHPIPGKGAKDWDETLQKMLDNTKSMQTTQQYSEYLNTWLYYLGQVRPCPNCSQGNGSVYFQENFDLSWIQREGLSAELQKTLRNIEANRYQGSHYYIGKGDFQQFEPKNEKPLYDVSWKDQQKRMTLLFRYWNFIEYFYPYKYQMEQSWDETLKEMIPKFQNVSSELDFHLALLELVVKLDDTQSTFITDLIDQMPYFSYLPVKLGLIENRVVITEIIDPVKARMDDHRVGDIISKIKGKQAITVHQSHKKYIPGSNEAMKNSSLTYSLFMGENGTSEIEIERNGVPSKKTISLYKYADLSPVQNEPGPKWTVFIDTVKRIEIQNIVDTVMLAYYPDDTSYIDTEVEVDILTKIGYVNMGRLSGADVNEMMNEVMDTKALIIDMRNKPRTFKPLAGYLLTSNTTFAKYILPDLSYPGKFVWNGQSACGENKQDSSWYMGKVVLLVNENTQSSGEFACMCFQKAPNVVVVGSQTAGTIGNVSRFPIAGRLYTTLTGTGVLYPDGSALQRRGIVPDVIVEPTLQGLIDERDEMLEIAREIALED